MNKYYTPEISEFHVGFEFEKEWVDGSWSKETLEVDDLKDIEEEMLPITRVKFLDKEDIESLGFIETNYLENTDYCITFEKVNKYSISEITYWYKDNYIEIYKAQDSDTQFQGNIRNKSELKKILALLKMNTTE
jgi:hypothetical protein